MENKIKNTINTFYHWYKYINLSENVYKNIAKNNIKEILKLIFKLVVALKNNKSEEDIYNIFIEHERKYKTFNNKKAEEVYTAYTDYINVSYSLNEKEKENSKKIIDSLFNSYMGAGKINKENLN